MSPGLRRGPLHATTAWYAVTRCFCTSLVMLGRGQIHQPRDNVGRMIRFADGSTGRVYRETVVPHHPAAPCFLAVAFRLRRVRGRGHVWFRRESVLNTPLFVGFPGFVSKLWLTHDENGVYRGLYEWDGADRAERYARSLWWVLALVSEPGSIDYRVFPGLTRAQVLADPTVLDRFAVTESEAWWRVLPATGARIHSC
jgi:hypothetical protein